MDCLASREDPRQPSNGTLHDFREILVISICAMLSDADNFEDIALWGRVKAHWLRRFLALRNGIPSCDTFERVFRILDPKRFEAVFRQWVGSIVTALSGQVAIDGKTLCGSADREGTPVHMVSAFATALGLVLGQEKIADKSNEIVCHERNRRSAGGSGVSPEMRVGPSRPAYRSRLQTATSCGGKESSW